MEQISIEKPKNQFVYNFDDVEGEVEHKIKNGLKKGDYAGFPSLHEHYTMQKGSMSFVIAPAGVGKSSLLYELMINTAQFQNWKWAIFSPEAGAVSDLYLEMMWAYVGKPIMKHDMSNIPQASDAERKRAKEFMKKHFYVIDSGTMDMTPEVYFNALVDLEEQQGIKLDGFLIDPFVEIDYNNQGLREDVALGAFLMKVRKYSSTYKVHGVVTVHTKNVQPLAATLPNGEKIFYTPQPSYTDAQSGMMWSRKGFMIISLWRPPAGMLRAGAEEGSGDVYAHNETVIEILKVKPKIAGKKGKVSLFYDWNSNRFYDEEGKFARPNPAEIPVPELEVKQEQIDF